MLNPGVSPTNSNINRSKTAPERKVGAMSNYTTRTPARSLSAGQIIRGEVTDLRNNEITVTLEDNTQVTGHLREGANLSIGETGAFLITNIQPDKISLELMPNSLPSSERITIQKALEEAGLPKNEKNQSIVRELLNNNMPIHKQSILNILTQSYQFKDISIPALVAMNRLGMEINEETAARFESLRTHENTFASEASGLKDTILSALKEASPEDMKLFRELLRLAVAAELEEPEEETTAPEQPPVSPSPLLPNGFSNFFGFHRLSSLLSGQQAQAKKMPEPQPGSGTVSPSEKEQISSSVTSFTENQKQILSDLTKPEKPMNPMAFYQKPVEVSEELKSLLDSLDAFSEKAEKTLSAEELLLRDAISLLHEAKNLADDIDFFQIEEARSRFLEKHPEFPELLEQNPDSPECEQLSNLLEQSLGKAPSSSSLLPASLLEQLESRYSQYLNEKGTIASLLTADELQQLTAAAKDLPFHPQFQERLADGDVTAKEFLTILRNTASLASDAALHSLISTDAFGKLFGQEFLGSFFLTPKEMEKPGRASEFFDETYEKLRRLSSAISEHQEDSSSDFMDMAKEQSGNMQKHLEFLKSFNELFTYVQLPAKLKNENLTSELYVYTKKESMREHPEQLSVLLHLDMDSLGPLDIHLSLHHATVTSRIYCEDADIKKFLASQISSLKTALNLKGYLFEADIEERKKPFDFVDDFIQKKESPQKAEEKPIRKRYTFDIRA